MSNAHLIDGKAIAERHRAHTAHRAADFQARAGRAPGLSVILVGDDPASDVYVRNKAKAAAKTGIASDVIRLPADTSQSELAALITTLNERAEVDGVLLQLPLPAGLEASPLVQAIAPLKDVDGFGYAAAGRVFLGAEGGHVPCTPLGCMTLITEGQKLLSGQDVDAAMDLSGKRAVVVGRSATVGLPMTALLVHANATVSIGHSRTQNLDALCREADILVAAVGRPEMVHGSWIKPGAIVIDVGINRVPAPEKGADATKLVGDVCFAEALPIAGAVTPVPGGVGPMTIACLLANTVDAAENSAALQTS